MLMDRFYFLFFFKEAQWANIEREKEEAAAAVTIITEMFDMVNVDMLHR